MRCTGGGREAAREKVGALLFSKQRTEGTINVGGS